MSFLKYQESNELNWSKPSIVPHPVGILNKSMKVSSNLLLFYSSLSLNRLAVREIKDFSVNSHLSLTTRGLHQTLLRSYDKDILRYLSPATLTL